VPREVTLTPEVRGSLSVHPIADVRRFGVDAFVTDRFGGVSVGAYESLNLGDHVGDRTEHVLENRRRVASAIDVDSNRLIVVRQVHGNDAVDADDVRVDTSADALHTTSTELAIAVLVADCVPVLLVDEATTRVCVAHAGWRGLRDGIAASAVALFDDPSTVHVFLGPCISAEGYQVGPEVAELFGHIPDALYSDGGDRSRLDLRRVAVEQLLRLGIDDEHISLSRQTTDGGGSFFSDRAARPCGRFGLVARRVVA
jgi:YfiH family protein